MSIISRIPRGLRVLLVMDILALLVWQFAYGETYFYYALGAAILLMALSIFFVYRRSSGRPMAEKTEKEQSRRKRAEPDDESEEGDETRSRAADVLSNPDVGAETIAVERDYTDIPPAMRLKTSGGFKNNAARADAGEVAARYRQMADALRQREEEEYIRPSIKAAAANQETVKSEEDAEMAPDSELTPDEKTPPESSGTVRNNGEPPIPLIEDESALTSEEINELVNAVWYRCENPYCKYTSFLSVHHIIEEKAGGSNALNNLIVLCPYCHSLAHRKEIPEKEMREWIVDREDRFKFKPIWQYFEVKTEEGSG